MRLMETREFIQRDGLELMAKNGDRREGRPIQRKSHQSFTVTEFWKRSSFYGFAQVLCDFGAMAED